MRNKNGTFIKGGEPWNKGIKHTAIEGNQHAFKGDARCDEQFRYEARNKLKHIKDCSVCKEEKTSYQMVVHHIDENIKNNCLTNLQKMCRSCHMNHHRHDIQQAKYEKYPEKYVTIS